MDNLESEKKNSPNISSEWQLNETNFSNPVICREDMSSSSSVPMVNSYTPTMWDLPTNSQNLNFTGPFGMDFPTNPMFVPNVPGILPQSLAQIPADSGFIERAARFSCFSDMMNPFNIHQSFNPYSKITQNIPETSIDASLHIINHVETEKNPLENEKNVSTIVKSPDEATQGGGGGGGASEMESDESSPKGIKSKKRKKTSTETQTKEDENTPSPTKKGSQTSEYIHVRARKGQATNSHSLAERVRREKISERMKFLQDLVPGCDKVTGKAVMLDEIINYVQSLQRQVEFLSMKLATVNPRMEFNVESLLTKDIFQPRAGPSSFLSFRPDMTMHYTSPNNLIQSGRSNGSQFMTLPGGYKDPTSEVSNVWEDELHNVIQMGLNSTDSDINTSLPQGHMKAEL